MTRLTVLGCGLMAAAVAGMAGGCARTARDTQGFAMVDAATVAAPLGETWQATKGVLREMGFDLYTRDKRGVFVAYSKEKRHLFVPHRVQYTVTLTEQGTSATTVTVETLNQVYGVTLLTYPGWHDRKTTDNHTALAILEAVQAKVTGAPTTVSGSSAVPEAKK